MSDPEIHDRSRVDAYAATRRRAMLLHSVWRPMLAGAVGAALVIAAVAIAQPRFTAREVVVDHVVEKDVAINNPVPHDVPINNPIPHDVVIEVPQFETPAERAFTERPEYQDAPYHGRIVASRGHGALSFADGKDFFPAHWDAATSQSVLDPERAFASEPFVGDLGMCRQDLGTSLWMCTALHNGREAPIVHKLGQPT
jgi:hypothetical protein